MTVQIIDNETPKYPTEFEQWWERNEDKLTYSTEDLEMGSECFVMVGKQVAFFIWNGGKSS